MKTCTICQEEVSPTTIRQGGAILRGAEVYHRDCHRSARGGTMAPPLPAPGADLPQGTSFPEIEIAQEYATFGRRLGAHLIDSVILNVVAFVGGFVTGVAGGAVGGDPGGISIVAMIIGGVLPLVYFVWFWSKKGATPGKLAVGIQVVRRDGNLPTAGQSFIRALGYIVSSLFFCLGFLWMLWETEKRTWHDMMADTLVVRI